MKWISIEHDRMPELLTVVLFWHEDYDDVLYGMAMPDGIHLAGNVYKCRYWMPLPDPPNKSVKLRINNTDYTFADGGENALKKRLFEKFKDTTGPNTIVEEWVDGELVNTTTLDGIFN